MKLGILSDSHGRLYPVQRAIATLEAAGAVAFAHCGDVGGPDILHEFIGRKLWFVWGNTDAPHAAWRVEIETLGFDWPQVPCEFTFGGRRFGLFHGHEQGFNSAMRSAPYDYLLHGHTHERRDERIGTMRVINPGALHRTASKTVAILDTENDHLEFLPLEG